MFESQPSHSGLSSAIAQPERPPQDLFSLKGELLKTNEAVFQSLPAPPYCFFSNNLICISRLISNLHSNRIQRMVMQSQKKGPRALVPKDSSRKDQDCLRFTLPTSKLHPVNLYFICIERSSCPSLLIMLFFLTLFKTPLTPPNLNISTLKESFCVNFK